MVHINHQQNNFSAGSIQPEYLGRADLNLYGNGVKAMHNMDILPSGALQKRQGTQNIMPIGTKFTDEQLQARLETFTSHDGRDFILVFRDRNIEIFEIKEDETIHHGHIKSKVAPYIRKLSGSKTIWENAPAPQEAFWINFNIDQFKIAKGENYFMICHKKFQPVLLIYDAKAEVAETATTTKSPPFIMRHWITHINATGQYKMPYSRFNVDESVKLKLETGIRNGRRYYHLLSETPLFDQAWEKACIRIKDNGGKEVEISDFINSKKLSCNIVGVTGTTSIEGAFTNDWSEAIFSDARGWPSCATFHQGRLILGSSSSFPKTIWMSKSGDYHDFTLGENNDSAIDITLSSSEAGEIRHFLSSKHLQIFTASSEWVITNEIITPSDITAQKRTSIGINARGSLAPLLLNGSSLFFDNENNLHEYTYASLEDSYVVNDISRLTDTETGMPLSMAYDSFTRRLFCPWSDESNNAAMKILNLYTAEKITAWGEYKTTGGNFTDIACLKGKIFALAFRYFDYQGNSYFSCYLEKFSTNAKTDCQTFIQNGTMGYIDAALQIQGKISLETETKELGLYYFNNLTNHITEFEYSGRSPLYRYYFNRILSRSGISADTPVFASLPIEAYIESLPPILISRESHSRYRILKAIFHIGKNDEFNASLMTAAKTFQQDNTNLDDNITRSVTMFGSGWSDNLDEQVWKIHFTNRSNFTLYGAEMHLSIH